MFSKCGEPSGRRRYLLLEDAAVEHIVDVAQTEGAHGAAGELVLTIGERRVEDSVTDRFRVQFEYTFCNGDDRYFSKQATSVSYAIDQSRKGILLEESNLVELLGKWPRLDGEHFFHRDRSESK